jgi:uncharacterized Zn-finger protein
MTLITSSHQSSSGAPLCPSGAQQCDGHHQQQARILTNFSIDSIIGQESKQMSQQQETEDQQRDSPLEVALLNSDCVAPSESNTIREQVAHIGRQSTHEVKKYRPKNFQCPVCGMAFSNNGQLKNHVRIHTGERPFRCNLSNCGKTFTRNEELTRHKLIHTGDRPHVCPSCFKGFGRKDHLKKHARTHERKKLRKGCYVPPEGAPTGIARQAEANNHNSRLLFSPKKEELVSREQRPSGLRLNSEPFNGLKTIPTQAPPAAIYNRYGDGITLPTPQPPPPVTFASQFLHPSTANTMAAIASSTSLSMLSTTTSGPLQQLASDYWQKWYTFLGLYQQRQ